MAETAIVRVCRADGSAAGTGFLVTPRLVLTCAHVVDGDTVRVEFPLLERVDGQPVAAVQAEVISLRPAREDDSGDTALLAIRELPRGARPAKLAADSGEWDDELRIFGFPQPFEHGVWVSGRLRSRQGVGWKQMESGPGHPGIAPGFSGSPVWSGDVVIGMTVATHNAPDATTAYFIPVETLKQAHPEITVPARNPYRGLEPFLEEHADVFYGRTDAVHRLTEAVRTRPVVVVSGPSGSGKSSLVLAGLLPQLNSRVVRFRPDPVLRPAAMLAAVLVPALDPGLSEVDMLVEKEKLAGLLTDPSPDLIALLAQRLDGLLVFADQFEEIAASDPDAARTLFGLLIALAPALRTVITLRSASLDELLTETTAETLDHGVMLLPPMSRSELYAAVTGPVTPGAFEPGLVERVLDDAGHNRLPLVQFALTQLWEGGALTHAAYDKLGSVSGALVTYAEECYLKLTETEQADARRLFVQLAVPEDDGFARKPARIADLDPELKPTLAKLAAYRLIVLDHAVDGAEIADIVHQALIQQWDRLRTWLTEDREFRSWQEQLRHRLDDPNRDLLRGSTLIRAQHWLTERPHDIPTPHRDFIKASISRQRREIRTWRTITAVIAALALIAGTLGVIAWQSNLDNERQLHSQASHLLGQESLRQATNDPVTALQLALSAWHNDKGTPEAYEALLRQQLAMGSATRIHHNLLDGTFADWTSTPDGRVIAIAATDSRGGRNLTVWRDLTESNPVGMRVLQFSRTVGFTLSDDGSTIAVAGENGSLNVWNLKDATAAPTVLRPSETDTRISAAALVLSGDGSRLLEKATVYSGTAERSALSVWDVHARKIDRSPVVGGEVTTLDFGPDPGTFLTGSSYGPVQVMDIATGAQIRALPVNSRIVLGGAAAARCTSSSQADVVDVRTGLVQRVLPDNSCGVLDLDATSRYIIDRRPARDGNYQVVILTDIATGTRYQTSTPDIGGNTKTPQLAVIARPGATPTVLAVSDRSVLSLRTTKPPPPTGRLSAASPDGHYGFTIGPGSFSLVDLRTNTETARKPDTWKIWNTSLFTSDSSRLVLNQDDSLIVLTVPDLREERRIAAKDYADSRCTPHFLATDGSGLIVLCGARLSRWDASTGAQLDRPDDLPLVYQANSLTARPGHADQFFAPSPDRILLWNIREHRLISTIQLNGLEGIPSSVVADPTGSKVAVYTEQSIRVWDLAANAWLYRPISPSTKIGYILGFGPADTLLTQNTPTVMIWKLKENALYASVNLPGDVLDSARLHGDRLTYAGDSTQINISLDPETIVRDLCQASDREATQDELRLYPPGALTDRPCR
ncbi:trypsin-like peptidase domain-containing protein [Actinocrispum sp. NPDC049592]|uniref:nSTAND1 domain-containing NTPase n=1 Tax=Actinocrispum sp. NPDC049592 TaxID=3154835 RepID=UPI003440A9BF